MQIGPKTREVIINTLASLTRDYLAEIDEAYTQAPTHLDLTFKVRLSPGTEGGVDVVSDLSFIKGCKVKDSARAHVDEHQQTLFGGEA